MHASYVRLSVLAAEAGPAELGADSRSKSKVSGVKDG